MRIESIISFFNPEFRGFRPNIGLVRGELDKLQKFSTTFEVEDPDDQYLGYVIQEMYRYDPYRSLSVEEVRGEIQDRLAPVEKILNTVDRVVVNLLKMRDDEFVWDAGVFVELRAEYLAVRNPVGIYKWNLDAARSRLYGLDATVVVTNDLLLRLLNR